MKVIKCEDKKKKREEKERYDKAIRSDNIMILNWVTPCLINNNIIKIIKI